MKVQLGLLFPIYEILVSWDSYSQLNGKIKKCLKPPTSNGWSGWIIDHHRYLMGYLIYDTTGIYPPGHQQSYDSYGMAHRNRWLSHFQNGNSSCWSFAGRRSRHLLDSVRLWIRCAHKSQCKRKKPKLVVKDYKLTARLLNIYNNYVV